MTLRQRFLPSSQPACLLAATGLWLATGCSTSGTAEESVTHPTMIEVAPESLLGNVPCSDQPGGLRRFVATLVDVTSDDAEDVAYSGEFTLASSPPTPCLSGVGFGFVVPGRKYRADIAGYDISEISPRAPGSAEMVDVVPRQKNPRDLADERRQIAAGNLVTPKWVTSCEPTTAVSVTIVQAACKPFPARAEGTAELRLGIDELLGKLECGQEPGQVERLTVSLDVGESEPRMRQVPCSAGSDIVFGDLPPRVSAKAFVSAYSAGSTQPLAGAQCQGLTYASASVTANCGPLSQLGTLRIDLARALASAGLTCSSTSIDDLLVLVPGSTEPRRFPPPDCLQPFDLGARAGAAAVTVTAVDAKGGQLASLTCGGEVVPGAVVAATCEPNPGP